MSGALLRVDAATREPRRILIVKPSSPGDIIHALPVLHALRRRYPDVHIAWLIVSGFADLIALDPALNEVIAFDRTRFGRVGRSWSVTRDFLRFMGELRARRFDLVVDLQGLFRSGFLARASGAAARVGFDNARELAWIFYSQRVGVPDINTHAVDRNLRVARALGCDDAPADFSLALSDADRAKAAAIVAEAGAVGPNGYAVLVPATRWETKCWPAERYGELAVGLRESAGLPSLLVGGRADIPAGARSAAASNGAAFNACGRTSLRELAALVEGASIVVTADSTPMHLAAALGRPLVALFGPTNPERTGPYGRAADVLRVELACSPCYLRRLSDCPHQQQCMQQLDVQRVLRAALDRLAEAKLDDPKD